jgi:hypothetical protein
MSKPIQLSHSARGKYDTCGKMYYNHYIEKIRPVGTTSALLFGTAVDQAAEVYLQTRDKTECRKSFTNLWNTQVINDVETSLRNCTEIDFHSADLDLELIPESVIQSVIKDTVYETASDLVKEGTDKERIAELRWLSLKYKGQLLVDAFINWVDENVEEILGTQIKIELEDDAGNKVPGLADFVMKIHGYDKPILVDLKTSARYYKRESVKESEQLGLYYFYLKQTSFPDMERAAYLVLNKQIKKNRVKTCLKCGHVTTGREQTCAQGGKGKNRCGGDFSVDITPEVVVQYIHDEIPEGFIQDTINKFNISVEGIKANKFEPCWDACDNYYGRKCPYYEFCRSGSMEGLFKKEKIGEQK